MTGANIIIQPPSRAKTGRTLYPPIVVKQSMDSEEAGAQYFATAVLLEEEGEMADGLLDGTKAATGFQLNETTPTVVYAFANLCITMPGTYIIRLDVYKVLAETATAGATLVEQLVTNAVTVLDGEVPSQQASTAEQEVLRGASEAGISLPLLP